MFLGRVVGEVVATIKHPHLHGGKLLLVHAVTPEGASAGKVMIAVDTVQAGPGDLVLVNDEGNGAAQVLRRPRGGIRTVIVGVVDEVADLERRAPVSGSRDLDRAAGGPSC